MVPARRSLDAMTSTSEPLLQSVQFLRGVGPARAEVLARLGIATVGDLLLHFPRAYEDLSDLRRIDKLPPATIEKIRAKKTG